MTVTRTASGGLAEDLGTFHARAKEWVTANLEPLDGADPYLGHATDDADQCNTLASVNDEANPHGSKLVR